jgi:membrane-bound inhibitor of C-type lysozyme
MVRVILTKFKITLLPAVMFIVIISFSSCGEKETNPETGIDIKYICGNKSFTIKKFEDRVLINLESDGNQYIDYEMKKVESGAGVERYSDGMLSYQTKGGRSTIEYNGAVLFENCIPETDVNK